MTFIDDIESTLENFEDKYGNSGWGCLKYEAGSKPVLIPELGTVQVVDSVGGYEDDGAYVHLVLKVTSDEGNVRWFKKEGYYASYDGTSWDGDFSEVHPREKTIVVYE